MCYNRLKMHKILPESLESSPHKSNPKFSSGFPCNYISLQIYIAFQCSSCVRSEDTRLEFFFGRLKGLQLYSLFFSDVISYSARRHVEKKLCFEESTIRAASPIPIHANSTI